MTLKAGSLLLFLYSTALAADDSPRPSDDMRIRAALRALAKADSIQVTGQLIYKDAEGGLITKPLKKEIRSRETISKLSTLFTSQRWEIMFRGSSSTIDPFQTTFLRLISFEKGRKADEFRLIGRSRLEHPSIGIFRSDPWVGVLANGAGSMNGQAITLILKSE